MTIAKFRLETRAWLEENCPPSTRGQAKLYEGVTKVTISDPDTLLWIERMVEKGWTVPDWQTLRTFTFCLLACTREPR